MSLLATFAFVTGAVDFPSPLSVSLHDPSRCVHYGNKSHSRFPFQKGGACNWDRAKANNQPTTNRITFFSIVCLLRSNRICLRYTICIAFEYGRNFMPFENLLVRWGRQVWGFFIDSADEDCVALQFSRRYINAGGRKR